MALVKPKKTAEAQTAPEAAKQTVADLAAELAAPEASRRRAAARLLVERPEGVALLLDHLATETAPSVRAVIFTCLVEHRSADIAAALSRHLESEDAMLRNAAIEALQAMPEEADATVATLLGDPASDVRIFAVNILSVTASERAAGRLVEVLETDDHVNVCAAAVDGLTEIGDEDAIPALLSVARRFPGMPFVQFAVETAVERIKGR